MGPAVGQAVGRLGRASTQAGPRLESVYRRLPASGGLPFGATTQLQRVALLDYYNRLTTQLARVDYRPRISIVVPTYKPDHGYLLEMLGSIALQVYPDWQLCIVDDASGDPEVAQILADFAAAHPGKVAYAIREVNGHIAATSNDALALADGEYVALLDHDDRLYPHALAEVVLGLSAHTSPDGRHPLVVYTDERMIDEEGNPIGEVWLKPDWMPLLHLTSNYTNHLTVYAKSLLDDLGGFRSGFDGSQDHDLMLRATEVSEADGLPTVHLSTIAYQWRSHPGSVAKDPGTKSYSVEPAMRAVAEACERRGHPARIWREDGFVANRIDFALPDPPPDVAVVLLPAEGDRGACAASLGRSTYPQLRVLLGDGGGWTASPEGALTTAEALDEVLRTCRADYLAVVADDLLATRADWVEAMVSLAQLPQVGAVGGLIRHTDGTVAAAGLIGLGSAGAAPAMAGMPPNEGVYLAWPVSIHEVLAAPIDALMVDVAAARAVGGFAAGGARLGFGGFDADLCLRLAAGGWRTAYTPYADFIEQAPRERRVVDLPEREELVKRWGAELSRDPYLNPGLARSGQFRVDSALTLPEVPPEVFAEWLERHRTF
ncbi:MAG: glycosyltransferase [Candidatus Nanopelagicales bacterium]